MFPENITPIRKQYLEIKKQYPNTILFFRLGDFYETFDKDAETTSKILDIVLTSRNVAKGQRIPMAGIPYHAAENYIGRLIEQGYHVAICEQVGEQPKKGLFPRKVVRVITPGTVIESGLLKNERNNYLLSILRKEGNAAIAYIDISTGEFFSTEFEGFDCDQIIRSEISRLNPAEILFPESQNSIILNTVHISIWPDWHFEFNRCNETLLNHFKTASLDGFGFRGKPLAIQTAGVILQYLNSTDQNALRLIKRLSFYSIDDFMVLDAATRHNLELTETIRHPNEKGSLIGVIDNTVTPMGKRLIHQWVHKPLIHIEAIRQRQEVVDFFTKEGLLRIEFKSFLRRIGDIDRLINRILTDHAIPRDLLALKNSLEILPKIFQLLMPFKNPLGDYLNGFTNCEEVFILIIRSISDNLPASLQNTGIIKQGYSPELDQLISNAREARDWISNLENIEKERTGIRTLKVGYNKIFGYYIEITHANVKLVPTEYIRKQTLVNAERYITPEMKEYETLILNSEERIHSLEIRLFKEICLEISISAAKLLSTSKCIAELDVLSCFAETSVNNNYCRPELVEDRSLEIREGRHPVVERFLTNSMFVPNDTIFEINEIIRIITGPNMSGKSTYLRQVALIVLLAQIGCFVPATQAKLGIVDRIFTRIGAQDEIFAGQSTFMVEMVETANILNNATSRSLIILDEIGRGTSTYDGLSIAWAVVEYIHNHPDLHSRTLFATHYHELTELSELLPYVSNFNVSVSEADSQVVFLHKIISGGADKSYGIHVGQIAGLPPSVIKRARELLIELEKSSKRKKHPEIDLSQQINLFPETNPILDELKCIDLNAITPLDAINHLHEWKKRFLK
jgi:DNA mismatch repair protein MutS